MTETQRAIINTMARHCVQKYEQGFVMKQAMASLFLRRVQELRLDEAYDILTDAENLKPKKKKIGFVSGFDRAGASAQQAAEVFRKMAWV